MKLFLSLLMAFSLSAFAPKSAKADACTPFIECWSVGDTQTAQGWIVELFPGSGSYHVIVLTDTALAMIVDAEIAKGLTISPKLLNVSVKIEAKILRRNQYWAQIKISSVTP